LPPPLSQIRMEYWQPTPFPRSTSFRSLAEEQHWVWTRFRGHVITRRRNAFQLRMESRLPQDPIDVGPPFDRGAASSFLIQGDETLSAQVLSATA